MNIILTKYYEFIVGLDFALDQIFLCVGIYVAHRKQKD